GPGAVAAGPGGSESPAPGRDRVPREAGALVNIQTADELVRTPLLTHEVGSLDKPSWRVKGFAGKALTDDDVEQARVWGVRLGVDGHEELLDLLKRAPLESKEDRELVRTWSSRYGLQLQESARVAVVYDGEQQRSGM